MSDRATVYREGEHDFLWFYCAGCETNHRVPVTGPRKWTWNGRVDLPTLAPSILVTWTTPAGAHCCHSFVTDGRIRYLQDSTHARAGQTVDLGPEP